MDELMFASKKLKMTRQRRVILDELQRVESHPSACDLYEAVRQRLPRISLGTVYRNLELLAECGLIRKLEVGGSEKRFDGCTAEHYHLRCVRCGRVDDALIEPVAGLEETVREASDYELIGHRLEFIGVCPQCGGKGQSTPAEAAEGGESKN